jgi:hypothetical protein
MNRQMRRQLARQARSEHDDTPFVSARNVTEETTEVVIRIRTDRMPTTSYDGVGAVDRLTRFAVTWLSGLLGRRPQALPPPDGRMVLACGDHVHLVQGQVNDLIAELRFTLPRALAAWALGAKDDSEFRGRKGSEQLAKFCGRWMQGPPEALVPKHGPLLVDSEELRATIRAFMAEAKAVRLTLSRDDLAEVRSRIDAAVPDDEGEILVDVPPALRDKTFNELLLADGRIKVLYDVAQDGPGTMLRHMSVSTRTHGCPIPTAAEDAELLGRLFGMPERGRPASSRSQVLHFFTHEPEAQA